MAVAILQTLAGLILVLMGMALAAKPLTTPREQWLCRVIFLGLGLLLPLMGWIQYHQTRKDEAALLEKYQVALSKRSFALPPPIQPEEAHFGSNQLELQQKYQDVLGELATDSQLAPNVRERIIVASAKLGRDSTASPQPPGAEAAAEREKLLPYFDYAIKTLAALSAEKAMVNKDKSASTYQGLPPELSAGAAAGQRSRFDAGEIRFQKNLAWDFQVLFTESAAPDYQGSLSMTCKAGVLVVRNSGDQIETKTEDFNGETFGHDPASGDLARRNIADAMQKLVAAESEALIARP